PTVIVDNFDSAVHEVTHRMPGSYVIKADGLAGGKGVVLPESFDEAEATLRDMMIEGGYSKAGSERVLIQDRFHGPEVSAFVVTDGQRFTVLPSSQDHKRLLDGDKGPNTGGMGAYAPVPTGIVSPDQAQKIQAIAESTILGMEQAGEPYQG